MSPNAQAPRRGRPCAGSRAAGGERDPARGGRARRAEPAAIFSMTRPRWTLTVFSVIPRSARDLLVEPARDDALQDLALARRQGGEARARISASSSAPARPARSCSRAAPHGGEEDLAVDGLRQEVDRAAPSSPDALAECRRGRSGTRSAASLPRAPSSRWSARPSRPGIATSRIAQPAESGVEARARNSSARPEGRDLEARRAEQTPERSCARPGRRRRRRRARGRAHERLAPAAGSVK